MNRNYNISNWFIYCFHCRKLADELLELQKEALTPLQTYNLFIQESL